MFCERASERFWLCLCVCSRIYMESERERGCFYLFVKFLFVCVFTSVIVRFKLVLRVLYRSRIMRTYFTWPHQTTRSSLSPHSIASPLSCLYSKKIVSILFMIVLGRVWPRDGTCQIAKLNGIEGSSVSLIYLLVWTSAIFGRIGLQKRRKKECLSVSPLF